MGTTRFWLIRHAESEWNAQGRWQGQLDPPLSERGREQAARLAGELAGEGLELLIASDLTRSAETAAIVGRALRLVPAFAAALREIDAGRWSGLTRAEIARMDAAALAHFDSGAAGAPAGGGECRRDVAERARRALAAAVAAHPGHRIAVVTHAGVIRSLLPGLRLANAEWRSVGDEIWRVDAEGS
jgi:probable phosphoglycerate mutase